MGICSKQTKFEHSYCMEEDKISLGLFEITWLGFEAIRVRIDSLHSMSKLRTECRLLMKVSNFGLQHLNSLYTNP